MSETTDPNLSNERYAVGQEIPDRGPSWDLIQEINSAAHDFMREHRMRQRDDALRSQFDLDIIYVGPSSEMGVRDVRIVLRGAGNRVNHSHTMSIMEFTSRTESPRAILANGIRLATDRWRHHDNERIQARLAGMPVEEWNARFEAALEVEHREFQRQVRGVEAVENVDGEIQYQVSQSSPGVSAPLNEDEDLERPNRDAMRRINEAWRQRLRRREESRDTEIDSDMVKTVLNGLKPIF